MSQPKVSVIIAVYKVEDYIERCLHTLFGQTLDDMEYIFVDDATPDGSMKIVERVLELYPHRKGQVKIVTHSRNQGIAAARTSGITAATGEYMIHCDPDDYIELPMYEEMYDTAKKDGSDLVFCDFVKYINGKTTVNNLNIPATPHAYLKQKGGINYWSPLWNALVRSRIIKDNLIIPFKGGDFAEDYGCMVRILFHSKTLSHIKKPFYHYDNRPTSVCNLRQDLENFKLHRINITGISEFLKDKKGFEEIRLYILILFKFTWKKYFKENPEEWFDLFPESNKAVFSLETESFKTRLLWRFLLTSRYFFKHGGRLYEKIKGESLL